VSGALSAVVLNYVHILNMCRLRHS